MVCYLLTCLDYSLCMSSQLWSRKNILNSDHPHKFGVVSVYRQLFLKQFHYTNIVLRSKEWNYNCAPNWVRYVKQYSARFYAKCLVFGTTYSTSDCILVCLLKSCYTQLVSFWAFEPNFIKQYLANNCLWASVRQILYMHFWECKDVRLFSFQSYIWI